MIKIGKDWTLFLDRDGVINKRIVNGYVLNFSQFEFLPGVSEALQKLSELFGRICVISNQQGVGKGLMTEDDLYVIHESMIKEVEKKGGRIDAVYCCTELAASPGNCRKPLPFMAYNAQSDFPDIVFHKTIMLGDTASDMEFGRNIGALTAIVGEENDSSLADFRFSCLYEFAKSVILEEEYGK